MSQWLEYNEVRYDLQEAVQRGQIRDLVELKKVSGISVRMIADTLVGMGEMESILDVYDSVERLEVFAAMLFLCKRKAGDPVTWDEACQASLIDITLVLESEEDEDPKAPDAPSTPEDLETEAETA